MCAGHLPESLQPGKLQKFFRDDDTDLKSFSLYQMEAVLLSARKG
jgi:hypothetical protein